MPNSHQPIFGCFFCKHNLRADGQRLTGFCEKHELEIDIRFVCADIKDESVSFSTENIAYKNTENLTHGILYFFSEVSGYGYPKPVERVPFAPIETCKGITKETRQELMKKANTTALEQYQKRLNK